MTLANNLDYEGIYGWCAGVKVRLIAKNIDNNLTWLDMAKRAAGLGYSVVVVSVNVEELKVIEWLKENKFKKSPMFQNHHHGGRKTLLYMKQVPKTTFEKYY